MAEMNSDSSSGENSGNSNTSDKSKSSKKSRSSWTQKWTSKSAQDGGGIGVKNSCYDDLMDRQSASKAVAIVVHTASKRGYVPLCTEFASLIRENKRMELEINRLKFIINQMHKKSIAGYKPEHNQCCSSSSTSESGSGGSHPLKIKKPHTKVRITVAPKPETQSTQSAPLPSNLNSPPASMEETYNKSEHLRETNKSNVHEELKTAKEQILRLESQVVSLTAENEALQAQLHKSQTHDKETITNTKNRTSPEGLIGSTQSSLAKGTLNPSIHHDNNCCMKSCVKHRKKTVSRTLTGHKISPTLSGTQQLPYVIEDTTTSIGINVMPHLNKMPDDKKPHSLKQKVLPKLGDYVTTKGEIKGLVSYVGPVPGESSDFVGIHLPSPVGNNDGTVDGVKYFSCPPNYGALIPLQYIENVHPKQTKPCKF